MDPASIPTPVGLLGLMWEADRTMQVVSPQLTAVPAFRMDLIVMQIGMVSSAVANGSKITGISINIRGGTTHRSGARHRHTVAIERRIIKSE